MILVNIFFFGEFLLNFYVDLLNIKMALFGWIKFKKEHLYVYSNTICPSKAIFIYTSLHGWSIKKYLEIENCIFTIYMYSTYTLYPFSCVSLLRHAVACKEFTLKLSWNNFGNGVMSFKLLCSLVKVFIFFRHER